MYRINYVDDHWPLIKCVNCLTTYHNKPNYSIDDYSISMNLNTMSSKQLLFMLNSCVAVFSLSINSNSKYDIYHN